MKIGLEIHCQLTTKTKLFCGCRNDFMKEPNTLTCETCLGMPGSKPRLNKKAVEYATKIGLALNCKFPNETFFSRKSYFYPDMSKNFQISQYELPFCENGYLETAGGKIRIKRIQLEEDPARIVHVGSITDSKYVLVDYNRSGTPLCEIVTEPDFTSTKQVRLFLQELSSILQYLDVFDPNLEGSMRADANISIPGGQRVEVKNISGFKDVESALEYEVARQRALMKRGEKVARETRHWDAGAKVTRSLRLKEEEEEYGYIFEPDLTRITLLQENISKLKNEIPELAPQKIHRYVKELKIQRELAVSIATEPDLAIMFEEVIKEADINTAAKWFAGELKKTLNYNNLRLKDTGLTKEHLAKLLKMISDKTITDRSGELMLREMVLRPLDPEMLAKKVARIFDESVLHQYVDSVIAENAQAVLDLRAGKSESMNFLVGQVMRKTGGRGDPGTIRELLRKRIKF
jgi:aspartyl-tRNA(Asn)/glutamyl-tRNA(Gln) amidotransferase subunit B